MLPSTIVLLSLAYETVIENVKFPEYSWSTAVKLAKKVPVVLTDHVTINHVPHLLCYTF